MFWALVAALFVSEAVYGFLPDDLQLGAGWPAVQWQLVILAAIGYSAHTYENTYRKAAMLIALLWALYIALTDWWLTASPVWLGLAEGVIFLGWLAYANHRTKKIQGLPEARFVVRDAGESHHREGGR